MGPLLFLVYINDIQQNQQRVKVLLYADDTVLYTHGSNTNDIVPYLQQGLLNYAEWSSTNKLTMNEAKTKLVYFTSVIKYKTLNLQNIDIKVNERKLHFVPTFKYLGVTLDYDLNFGAHVKELKSSLAFKSYLLGKLRHYVPTPILLRIYKTYALPVIDYSDTLYNGANVDLLKSLQRVQNRCLKYCLKLPVLSSTDFVHQEAGLPMLNERRKYHARIIGYKKSKIPRYCAYNRYPTRAFTATVLKYHTVHTASYERSLEVYISQQWNALTPDIRNLPTIAEI